MLRLVPEDGPAEPQQGVDIGPVVVLQDEGLEVGPEDPAVDGHEEGLHVQLDDPGLTAVPHGDLLDLHGEGLHGGDHSEVLPAVEGDIPLAVEALLDERDEADADPVLDDTVPEVSREDLAEAGLVT